MPRTLRTGADFVAPYATSGGVVAFVAMDATNGDEVAMTGADILLVRNPTGGALTLTVNSEGIPPAAARLGNYSQSIAAGALVALDLPMLGWADAATGRLELTASAAGLEMAMLRRVRG